MKSFAATLAALGLLALGTAGSALGNASSPPSCFGQQQISPGAQTGLLGPFVSGYAHYFNSIGTNLGQAGVPYTKEYCPVVIPPPPAT